MFRSPFYLSVIQPQEGFWQPAMLSRAYLDPDEDPIWAAGWHYANRSDAEQAARQWAKREGTGYEFIAPEEAAA